MKTPDKKPSKEKKLRRLDFSLHPRDDLKTRNMVRHMVAHRAKQEIVRVAFSDIELKILNEKKEHVGDLHLRHFRKPYNFFLVKWLNIEKGFKGRSGKNISGYGGTVVRNLNKFLDERGAVGVLQDATGYDIYENKEEVEGFYKKHGWKELVKGNSIFLVRNFKGPFTNDFLLFISRTS